MPVKGSPSSTTPTEVAEGQQGLPPGRTCLAAVVTQIPVKEFDFILKDREGWRNEQVGASERRGVGNGRVTIVGSPGTG